MQFTPFPFAENSLSIILSNYRLFFNMRILSM
nr:MAG TPA: hypothetical protein [Caudoviricetes sp.]